MPRQSHLQRMSLRKADLTYQIRTIKGERVAIFKESHTSFTLNEKELTERIANLQSQHADTYIERKALLDLRT